MSSVAVYGNDPPPESASEDAPARRTGLPYGDEKLGQELRVRRSARRHALPVVILRPPNVYGPFSSFTLGLLEKIRSGTMAIVDGGRNPCNLVYVDNVIQAVLLALWKPEAVGQTFFVADLERITWEQCLEHHAEMLGTSLPRISSADLVAPARERRLRDSLRALPGVVISPDFRRAVQRVPLIRDLEQFVYQRFESLSPNTRQSIRLRLHGPERHRHTLGSALSCQRQHHRGAGAQGRALQRQGDGHARVQRARVVLRRHGPHARLAALQSRDRRMTRPPECCTGRYARRSLAKRHHRIGTDGIGERTEEGRYVLLGRGTAWIFRMLRAGSEAWPGAGVRRDAPALTGARRPAADDDCEGAAPRRAARPEGVLEQ